MTNFGTHCSGFPPYPTLVLHAPPPHPPRQRLLFQSPSSTNSFVVFHSWTTHREKCSSVLPLPSPVSTSFREFSSPSMSLPFPSPLPVKNSVKNSAKLPGAVGVAFKKWRGRAGKTGFLVASAAGVAGFFAATRRWELSLARRRERRPEPFARLGDLLAARVFRASSPDELGYNGRTSESHDLKALYWGIPEFSFWNCRFFSLGLSLYCREGAECCSWFLPNGCNRLFLFEIVLACHES